MNWKSLVSVAQLLTVTEIMCRGLDSNPGFLISPHNVCESSG